jgi:hypothetical protein
MIHCLLDNYNSSLYTGRMDYAFLLSFAILTMFVTWVIGVAFNDVKAAFVTWLFFAASAPFVTATLWKAAQIYMSPEIASDIINNYVTTVITPVVDNLPAILISILVGTNLGITLVALTRRDSQSPTR